MKELEAHRIDQLLGIINLYPSVRVMHFSDGGMPLSRKISNLCEAHGYDYELLCTGGSCLKEASELFHDVNHVTFKEVNLKMPRYAMQAKKFDYLFVTCDIPLQERLSFLKKCYDVIKSAGLILIFVPKGDLEQLHTWNEYLQDNYFVATNTLDIFSEYDVIISKKMHGWGG